MSVVMVDVAGKNLLQDDRLINGSVAFAQIGGERAAGLVTHLRSRDGIEFSTFFTGHSRRALPAAPILADDASSGAPQFALTGRTFRSLAAEQRRTLDVYYAFALEVFAVNFSASEYDFYAAMNAAFALADDPSFERAHFTHGPVDRARVAAAAHVVVAARQALWRFVDVYRGWARSAVT